MSESNEGYLEGLEIEEYIEIHSAGVQQLLIDLKSVFEKHKETLHEEQFFAVWNESPLSRQINKEGLSLYHTLVLIAEDGLGIKVIKEVWE
ncbi:hypothetical protein [Bacillus cereus]|uniref:hypothetical protein n=1 Tax=Bacillus cereus TaxID=1396 RepID=UPI000BF5FE25|nr:hypothetical protein [Bacillus cereus]PFC75684.1 hypothetical protein CN276_16540 [Bacillus cereus]